MRHQSQEYLQKLLDKHGPFEKVLEVGSLNVNGKLSDLFGDEYTGVDMRDGDNVDKIVNGHDLVKEFGEEVFDLVICFDTMEHDNKFWETMENMKGVLKHEGYLVIGVPSLGCPEHDHPHDYWRFMPQGVKEMMDGFLDIDVEVQKDEPSHLDDEIYAMGRKP